VSNAQIGHIYLFGMPFGLLKAEAAFVITTNKRLNLNQCGSQFSGTM